MVGLKLEEFKKDEPEGDWPFCEVVGSLMWLANQTRPDISNAVRAVARYARAPKSVHWGTALSILKYLKTTSDLDITYQRGSGLDLDIFADADYASKATDRRSVSGGVVMCGGTAVSWFSRTQNCLTLSTTEAEQVAMSECAKEALSVRHVWCFILPALGMPCMKVFEDNIDAVHFAQNPVTNSSSKHIDVRHHHLGELYFNGDVVVIHVASEYQHADFLTNPLSKDAFEFHRNFLMNLSHVLRFGTCCEDIDI